MRDGKRGEERRQERRGEKAREERKEGIRGDEISQEREQERTDNLGFVYFHGILELCAFWYDDSRDGDAISLHRGAKAHFHSSHNLFRDRALAARPHVHCIHTILGRVNGWIPVRDCERLCIESEKRCSIIVHLYQL